jgi:putative ABC transport system substrate-binding protein
MKSAAPGSIEAREDRRGFLGALSAGAVAASFPAVAQTARTAMPTIGYLGPPASVGAFLRAFQQGLADHGYVEGRNVRLEYRYNTSIQGNRDSLDDMAAELVRLKPDVIVVSLTEVAVAVRNATGTIPIVMANVGDPVAAGLVASLAHPGGNVTGVGRETPELISKQLQLLNEVLPKAARVGVLMNPTDRLRSANLDVIGKTAEALGIQVEILGPGSIADIEDAFATLRKARAAAVLVGGGGVFFLTRHEITDLALRSRLPSMASFREFVEIGGLMSYGANSVANYRRAAFFVDRILKGTRPADLPVEQPTKYEFVVNLKTAKALGISIPPAVLLRADEVIR